MRQAREQAKRDAGGGAARTSVAAWRRGGARVLAAAGLFPLLLAFATVSACDPDPLFEPCPLSHSIQQACAAEAQDTLYSCVVADHPFCLEGVCASWLGQPPVCTKACASDADCPEGTQCKTHLDLQFCVLDEDLEATAAQGGGGQVAPSGADAGGADAGTTDAAR